MRDEKGITLLELIAAVSISAVVLGGAFLLFASLQGVTDDAVNDAVRGGGARFAVDTLAEQLLQSSQARYVPELNELRFTVGGAVKAAVFDPAARTLVLYDFSADGDAANDSSHYYSDALSLAANPALYTRPVPLSEDIRAFRPEPDGFDYADGETFQIAFLFEYSDGEAISETASVKLLRDRAQKL